MLNQITNVACMERNTIEIAIARARRERDAEVARLLGIAYNGVRTAISRGFQRASAAMHVSTISGNTRHA